MVTALAVSNLGRTLKELFIPLFGGPKYPALFTESLFHERLQKNKSIINPLYKQYHIFLVKLNNIRKSSP